MTACPLTTKKGALSHPIEDRGDGWYLPAAKGLRGQMRCPQDAIICRVSAGGDPDVMQFGIGDTSSLLCNALFLPAQDEALVFTAEGLRLEKHGARITVHTTGPLQIKRIRDYMKVHRNVPWFRPLDRKHFPRPPAGWCSWYHYYFTITEAELLQNTDWLSKNLKAFGCDVVQIDEGWADNGSGFGANRNFFVTNQDKFPRGMKYSADYIRKRGLTPGIWCCPLGQSDTTLYTSQPDMFIHRADGSSAGELKEPKPDAPFVLPEDKISEWGGRYYLDPTSKSGQRYLQTLFTMMCHEWGYEYVKIDGQIFMPWVYMAHRERLADPSQDAWHAYRSAMKTMSDTMGPKRFLLNCGEGFTSVGYCQGVRTGGDAGLSWDHGIMNAAKATARWGWLNTVAFYTDPDVVCVRDPLPFDQARAWTVLLGLTGQLLMLSDKMYELTSDRVELLRKILPVADIHPMELYPMDANNPASLINLKVNLPLVGTWDVVAAFNWNTTTPKCVELNPWRFGLERGPYLWIDTLTGLQIDPDSFTDDATTITVAPASCRVFTIWPEKEHPQFVGSTRHVTQGAVDITAVKWDPTRSMLRGTCELVGGHETIILAHIPSGYKVRPGANVKQAGRIAMLRLRQKTSGHKAWSIGFTRTE